MVSQQGVSNNTTQTQALPNLLGRITVKEKVKDILRMKTAYWTLTACTNMTIAQNTFQWQDPIKNLPNIFFFDFGRYF
jgi:predicted anti-sigma-YlaC factor YlaD